MLGGKGDDLYQVDQASDHVFEFSNGGHDVVMASVDYFELFDNVEDLIFAGAGSFTGTGNGSDNFIQGAAGNDSLLGEGGMDTLVGGEGNDTLNGRSGADQMLGGDGDDVYFVDDVNDIATDAFSTGADEIRTTLATYKMSNFDQIENLTYVGLSTFTGTGNNLNNLVKGSSGADTLEGLVGNDTLDGGAGADNMRGASGNDVYIVDDAADVVIENPGEGTDEIRVSLSAYSISNAFAVEVLKYVGSGNFNGVGNVSANQVIGGSGSDTLDGGKNADTMLGGLGNDTYIVDALGDVVTESLNEGVDTVVTSITSFTLDLNIENLTLASVYNSAGTGNGLANVLTAATNARAELHGLAGADTIFGGGLADYLYGESGRDSISGGDDGDRAYGGDGNDTIFGGTGFDTLDGGVDTDVVNGDVGLDLIYGGDGADTLDGGDGGDTIWGGIGDDSMLGGAALDVMYGEGGNDTLDGGAGPDSMRGGVGNDTYFVDTLVDIVVESSNEGIDTIATTLNTFSLSSYFIFENLSFSGIGDFIGTGSTLGNLIVGGGGSDVLDGVNSPAGDTLNGGAGGDDIFYVRNKNDVIIAHAGGVQTVYEGLASDYVMPTNITVLHMTSIYTSNAFGNGLANTIIGSSADNRLDVRAGGAATLTGGSGKDTFVFQAGKANGDVVTDFSGFGGDNDRLEFHGYGFSWNGANLSQIDATHWMINSSNGLTHDTITLSNAALVLANDFKFLA